MGSCSWLVKSKQDPQVWALPVTYGYERRTVRISSTQKQPIAARPTPPLQEELHFPTWGAQLRNGAFKQQQGTPVISQTSRDSNREAHQHKRIRISAPSDRRPTPMASGDNTMDLKEQLAAAQQQSQAQMAQISQLTAQVQQLMSQLQTLMQTLQGDEDTAMTAHD